MSLSLSSLLYIFIYIIILYWINMKFHDFIRTILYIKCYTNIHIHIYKNKRRRKKKKLWALSMLENLFRNAHDCFALVCMLIWDTGNWIRDRELWLTPQSQYKLIFLALSVFFFCSRSPSSSQRYKYTCISHKNRQKIGEEWSNRGWKLCVCINIENEIIYDLI